METSGCQLLVETEYSEHRTENLTVIDNDRIHGIILRLETDMSLLLIESLDGSGIIDQGHNDFTVIRCVLDMNEDTVTVENTGIDHGLSADIQNEGFSLGYYIGGNREVVLNVLFGQNRLPGSNITDHGEADHLGTHHLEAVVADLNGTGLGRVSADVAVLLQSL